MSYVNAYAELLDSSLALLQAIESPEDARPFIERISMQVDKSSAKIPEFYVGEFFNILKDAVVEHCRIEADDCERALREANAEAERVSAELQIRLEEARAVGDWDAQHAVWRDREVRQAACQAKVDSASIRAEKISLRLAAFQELASSMGVDFN